MKDKGVDYDTAFRNTGKQAKEQYDKELERLFKAACGQTEVAKGHTHCLFMDKNHPPSALPGVAKFISRLEQKNAGDTLVRTLYVLPEAPKTQNRYLEDIPAFSENFVAQVFSWGQNRKDHETLDNSNPANALEVQTMFLKLNQDISFEQEYLERIGINGLLRVPLAKENLDLPVSLLQTLGEYVREFAGIGKEENEERNTKMLEELEKSKDLLNQFTDISVLVEAAMTTIKEQAGLLNQV